MKKILAFILVIIAVANVNGQPSRPNLDSLMNFYAAEYNFNGVAFISWKGDIMLDKGYGYRDIGNGIKNDENSIFMIGSNTKQFTSELILQLAMQQKLGVQDLLSKYFPDYKNGNKITLENLLTHTSGIYNYTDDSTWQGHPADPISEEKLLSLFRDKELLFEPGSKFEYSNSNYILLGCIIEMVTGKTYQQVIRDNILTPLGMVHTGFDYIHLQDKNKATGYYTIQGDKYNQAPLADSTTTFAAGSMYADVADMYKWHKALQSYKLLPKEWQEKAFVPFKGKYGYGWFADTGYGKKLVGHSGGVPGFYTYEMRVPEDDVCILLFQNCEMPAMDNNTICKKILSCMYDANYKLPQSKKAVEVSSEILLQYAGVYNVTKDFSITITVKGDELYAQGTDQDDFKINSESETKFYSKEVGAEIEFKKDEKGKVEKLILTQGGQKIPAIRI